MFENSFCSLKWIFLPFVITFFHKCCLFPIFYLEIHNIRCEQNEITGSPALFWVLFTFVIKLQRYLGIQSNSEVVVHDTFLHVPLSV